MCPTYSINFLPQLIDRVGSQDQHTAEILKQLLAVGRSDCGSILSAIYFGGMDWNAPQPTPRLALLCDAGRDGPELAGRMSKLIQNTPDGPVPIVKQYDSLVVLAFGTPASVDADFAQIASKNLANSSKLMSSLSQVQSSAAITEFFDMDGLVKLANEGFDHAGDAHINDRWKHARDALSLGSVHQAIVTSGFDGRDWSMQMFVSTDGSSQGIASLFNCTALSSNLLAVVPQSADRMVAGRFDVDSFVGHVRDVIGEIDQNTADQFDAGLAQINQTAEFDIRKDLLSNLGDEWVYYSDRAVGGLGLLGSVIVNRLHDAAAADKAMTQLAHHVNDLIAQLMHNPQIKIEFRDSIVNGVTVHYLAVPLITPCWAVKDGNLYLGMYPQIVSAAVDQVARKGPSILQRSEYAAMLKRLGDRPASSVQFYNLPETAPDGYSDLLAISRLYLGAADIFGVNAPAMVVPPLSKILPELSPSGAVGWSDSAGYHMKTISPFLGSEATASASVGSALVIG